MKKLFARLVTQIVGPIVRQEIKKHDAARAQAICNFSAALEKGVLDFIRSELKRDGSLRR